MEYLHCAPFTQSSVMPRVCVGLVYKVSSRQPNKILKVEAMKKIRVEDNKKITEASLPGSQAW